AYKENRPWSVVSRFSGRAGRSSLHRDLDRGFRVRACDSRWSVWYAARFASLRGKDSRSTPPSHIPRRRADDGLLVARDCEPTVEVSEASTNDEMLSHSRQAAPHSLAPPFPKSKTYQSLPHPQRSFGLLATAVHSLIAVAWARDGHRKSIYRDPNIFKWKFDHAKTCNPHYSTGHFGTRGGADLPR